MGELVSFQVTGLDSVQKGFLALLNSAKDLRPFWREVFAPRYFAMVQDLFATGGRARGAGGRFSGGAWAKLSPAYKVWKSINYPGQPILVRTGALRNSMVWTGTGPGPGGIFQATPSFAIAGTSIPYGRYHQTGTDRMPARPFAPPPDPAVFAPLLHPWLVKAQAAPAGGV